MLDGEEERETRSMVQSRRRLERAAAALVLALGAAGGCSPEVASPATPTATPTAGEVSAAPSAQATPSSAGPTAPAATGATAPEPGARSSAARECQPKGKPERLELARGAKRTTADGLGIQFAGVSHDSYADGHGELLVSLELSEGNARGGWLPTLTSDRRFVRLFGRCLRLVGASEQRVVLEVAAEQLPSAP